MKSFFGRREKIEDNLNEDGGFEIIDLDDTAEWSKFEVEDRLAKEQAENLMEEIGDELAIIDAVEEDTFIEELRQSISSEESTYEAEVGEEPDADFEETDVAMGETKVIEADVVAVLEKTEIVQEEPETEELQDEDIEYMSEEDEEEFEEEDGESGLTFFGNLAAWFSQWTVIDKVIAVTGILVLVLAIATAGLYAANSGVNKQIAAFAPVGEQLETIGIIGRDKLLAVADAKKTMLEAAKLEAELNQEYEEGDYSSEVKVIMKMTTVHKDLKIKFVNKRTGKLVGNVPFEVKIKDSEDKTYNKIDEDKDGIIYLTDIVAGDYSVTMVELEGLEGYSFSTSTEKIKVKDKIEYEKIDVSDEIKDQSEVDASKEDTAQKTETEEILVDTVEWVITDKKAAGTETTYKAVDKSTIAEPSLTASLNFDFGILRIMQQSMLADNVVMPAGEVNGTTTPSISLSQTILSLEKGASDILTVNGVTEGTTINWASSNPEVASVDNLGKVTANAAGTATITAISDADGNLKATCEVTVKGVTGISLDKAELTLELSESGKTGTISATVTEVGGADTTVNWNSANTGIATVTNGTITAIAEGSTVITATAGDKSATCTVTVSAAIKSVTAISLSETSLNLIVGGATATLEANIVPADATYTSIKWESSNANVATVENGVVTAVGAGSANIIATANGGTNVTATCAVTVSAAAVAVDSITLDKTSLELAVGGTYTLTATVKPDNASDRTVTWSSSDATVAKVETGGKVTALKEGKATIEVKSGEKTATCSVKVNPKGKIAVTGVAIKPDTVKLDIGQTQVLEAVITPADATDKTVTWSIADQDKSKATVDDKGCVTAKAEGEVTVTVTTNDNKKTATCKVTIVKGYDPKTDTTKLLKDKGGNQMYVLVNGQYVEAKVADYYKSNVTFYKKEQVTKYIYTGWQNLDGKTYFFDKNGNKVTGQQVIQGAKYNFNSDGTLNTGSGVLGIDVSTWNGNIDWNKVKASGVSYVIIRTGYRGSTQGALVEDNKFRQNIQGATNAGLKVGVYFFTQAINEVEAVEEASMVLGQIKGYKLAFPVFIDVESSGGRADGLSTSDRTKVVNAFCQTIQNNGYRAGIYANKTWFTNKLNTSALSGYKIWLAQYNSTVTYKGRYDMWQYSDKGKINGINGNVDMNLSYLSY